MASTPILFSYGFRPFFLGAISFAVFSVMVWTLFMAGSVESAASFPPIDWHIHEMIFGYASAVIAGFLFTAIPNWTGRMPLKGWPLASLFCLWLAGRVVMFAGENIPSAVTMAIDCSFLGLICLAALREIIAGKNCAIFWWLSRYFSCF